MNKAKEEFYNKIKQAVQNYLGNQYLVSVQTVEKTNVTLTGLCIKERTCNIAPTIYLEEKQDCNATVLIHNSHMEMWKTNTKELFDLATVNTRKMFAPAVKTMEEMMEEILKEKIFGEASKEVINGEVDEIYGLTEPMEKCPMYVLSNVQKVNGACAILYDDVLKNIAKRVGSDLWIVPSSIHETLLIPCEAGQTFEGLQQMIREVNETTVEACDILSDHPYFYSLKENQISIRTEILISA